MPPDIWIMDVATGSFRQLTKSPHAGVDLAKLVRPELLKFKAHDGLELSGWFYKPAVGTAPYPTVLSFHGGPEGQERPGFNSLYQALLARGIAVFAPNVRGSAGFGKTFVNLDNGAKRFDGVKDIKDCVDAVVKVVKVVGFVASAPGFGGQPGVINGASELFGEIFAEAGAHARSAVGVSELPRNVPVEVEIIVEVA